MPRAANGASGPRCSGPGRHPPTDTVSVVAGDFFGPRVRNSHAGERMVRPVLAGKSLW